MYSNLWGIFCRILIILTVLFGEFNNFKEFYKPFLTDPKLG